jgi:hypothetical protein
MHILNMSQISLCEMAASEGAIVECRLSDGNDRRFIVVFQNNFNDKDSLSAVNVNMKVHKSSSMEMW